MLRQEQSLALVPTPDETAILAFTNLKPDEVNAIIARFQPPPPPPTKFNLMASSKFIEAASEVIAALSEVRYKRQRAVLFTNSVMASHCDELMNQLFFGEHKDDWPSPKSGKLFKVNEWFSDRRGGDLAYDPCDPKTDIKLTKFGSHEKENDWLQVLIEAEEQNQGFVTILLNCITLSESVGKKIADRRRKMLDPTGQL